MEHREECLDDRETRDMIFNVATYVNSSRVEEVKKLLDSREIDYKIHFGVLSPFGWDEHKNTCMKIIEDNYNSPYTIIAEDDLELTSSFTIEKFKQIITEKNANIICTGIFCEEGVISKDGQVYIDRFRGTQLIVIFKEAYDLILNKKDENKFFEVILSEITEKKLITIPFLSTQSDKYISRISQHKMIKRFITETENRINKWSAEQ